MFSVKKRNGKEEHQENTFFLSLTLPPLCVDLCIYRRTEKSHFFFMLVALSLAAFFPLSIPFSLNDFVALIRERKIRGERHSQYLVFCQT